MKTLIRFICIVTIAIVMLPIVGCEDSGGGDGDDSRTSTGNGSSSSSTSSSSTSREVSYVPGEDNYQNNPNRGGIEFDFVSPAGHGHGYIIEHIYQQPYKYGMVIYFYSGGIYDAYYFYFGTARADHYRYDPRRRREVYVDVF